MSTQKKPSKSSLSAKDTAPNFPNFYPEYAQPETFSQKVVRKTSENPFVPIGLGATIAALTMGLLSMVRGDQHRSQLMMRARVGAQGFTVFTLLAGVLYQASKRKNGEKVKEIKDEFLDKINHLQDDEDYLASMGKK